MVATLNKSTRPSSIANQSASVGSVACFLQISRLSDLHDDATMEALRRAAAIRQTWSQEEIERRKSAGQQRRNELAELLGSACG